MTEDPEDDPAPGDDEFARLTCLACGAAIDPSEWHPVRARIDDDGDIHLDPFCSHRCRDAAEE